MFRTKITKQLIYEMEEYLNTYCEIPVPPNDEFYRSLDVIYDGLLSMNISYNQLGRDSDFIKTLKNLNKILQIFKKNDMDPVNININFTRFMQLSRISAQFKSIIASEILIEQYSNCAYASGLFQKYNIDNEMEQYICDVYKSKIEAIKSNYDENIVHTINKDFTLFLIDFVKLLSQLNDEVPLKKNIELLLEVADNKSLLQNFHSISFLISSTMRIRLMKKMTNFCIENKCSLLKCGFLISKHQEFRLEANTISYFILQRICKYLELQEMHQTSKILSLFTIDNIFSNPPEFKSLHEKTVEHITFKTYKKIKALPLDKIKKCLDTLKILIGPQKEYQVEEMGSSILSPSINLPFVKLKPKLYNCPFPIVFLSLLSDLIMATDLDKDTTLCLIDLINGYLKLYTLPSNFSAVSYAFNIYQKMKTDSDLEFLSKVLYQNLLKNMVPSKNLKNYLKTMDESHLNCLKLLTEDLEKVLNIPEYSIDTLIIGSYFFIRIEKIINEFKDETLNNLLWALNENVLLSTQYAPTNALLILPYSVSLHFSIKMKNEDCLLNNLAIIDNYLAIFYEANLQLMEHNRSTDSQRFEQEYFLKTMLCHYEHISHCLPDDFLVKCWELAFFPQKMKNTYSKQILRLCSFENLSKIIDILKTITMEILEKNENIINDYSIVYQLWSDLLGMEFINKKKIALRKELVNHFCFTLNKTFIFNSKKVQTEKGLILLIRLICLLLKISWVNRSMLMNCSLRIMSFVERRSSINDTTLLTAAAELLIVLYKCSDSRKLLGLFVITFSNFLKKCWSICYSLASDETTPLLKLNLKDLYLPFHKLQLCSSLFKLKKNDFEVICQYFIADLINIIATQNHPRGEFLKLFHNILFNLMDVCSPEEMKQLMNNIEGRSLLILKTLYTNYQNQVQFRGRL